MLHSQLLIEVVKDPNRCEKSNFTVATATTGFHTTSRVEYRKHSSSSSTGTLVPSRTASKPTWVRSEMFHDMTLPLTFLIAFVLMFSSIGGGGCAKEARTNWIPAAFASWGRTATTTMTSTSSSHQPGMPVLPADVIKYSQVPAMGSQFTAKNIPSGLLKQHSTKQRTWGMIRVSIGKLSYQINEPIVREFVLTPDTPPGIIEPKVLHQVKPLTDDLGFVVEFLRLPDTGPVDERREGL